MQREVILRSRPALAYIQTMGYPVKIQKVERPTNRSDYLNFPVALPDALRIKTSPVKLMRMQKLSALNDAII